MKVRAITLVIFTTMLMGAAYQVLSATTAQLWLSGALVTALLGILLLDEENRFLNSNTNSVLYGLFSTLLFLAINAQNKERFFLIIAGASLVLNVFSEKGAEPWHGRVFGQSPILSSLLFFVLVSIACMPRLTSQTVLLLELIALMVLCCQELFCLQRQNAKAVSFSIESILRTVLCGFGSYMYGHAFLPQVAAQEPLFAFIATAAAGISLFLAACSLFEKQIEKKQIYFSTAWLLLLFWGAVVKAEQGYLVVAGTVFAAWVLASTKEIEKEFYSKTFSFACPGTLLFLPLLGILWPMESFKGDLLLWVFAFIVFWLGLTRTENNGKYNITVRQGALTILTTLLVVVILLGINLEFLWEKF